MRTVPAWPGHIIDGAMSVSAIESRIARVVGRPAQVVVLNTAPAGLIHRVLRDGVLLLDRAPGARIRFEVKARNEFFDLQPILTRYRRRPVPSP
jgi:hypothetical protein